MPFKIYYLDDEIMLCENFADLISSATISVETFQDAQSFLARCAVARPDLAILDYRLPGTTGHEVAKKIDASIPKILISGDIHVSTSDMFQAVLEKPTKVEDLLAMISKFQALHERKA